MSETISNSVETPISADTYIKKGDKLFKTSGDITVNGISGACPIYSHYLQFSALPTNIEVPEGESALNYYVFVTARLLSTSSEKITTLPDGWWYKIDEYYDFVHHGESMQVKSIIDGADSIIGNDDIVQFTTSGGNTYYNFNKTITGVTDKVSLLLTLNETAPTLPDVTAEDNDKALFVQGGAWSAQSPTKIIDLNDERYGGFGATLVNWIMQAGSYKHTLTQDETNTIVSNLFADCETQKTVKIRFGTSDGSMVCECGSISKAYSGGVFSQVAFSCSMYYADNLLNFDIAIDRAFNTDGEFLHTTVCTNTTITALVEAT